MDSKVYRRYTDEYFKGRKVRTLCGLHNGWINIPPDTVCIISRKYMGFSLETEPCPHCGVKVFITRVSCKDVELVEEVITK